jgi:hypothetical protein
LYDLNVQLRYGFTGVRHPRNNCSPSPESALYEGEHPFIKYESVIDYSKPIYTEIKNIETLVKAGEITPHETFDKPLLKRVLEGADESVLLPSKYNHLLFGE